MKQETIPREKPFRLNGTLLSANRFSIADNLPLFTIIFIAIILLLYTIIRAGRIEFTVDEIYSWKVFTYGPHLYPPAYDETTANDHWLNSWLMQLTGYLFGERLWALRLPNLIAHAVYLFFTARFVLSLRRSWFAVFAFILLNAHPYLLDFFSVARGYGLAFASIAACLFFLRRFIISGQEKSDLKYLLAAAILALLANFAVISFVLAVTGIAGLIVLLGKPQKKILQLTLIALIMIPVLLIVVPHLLRMQKSGALYYGETSLWEGTVKTVTESLLYGVPYAGENHFCSAKPTIWFLLAGLFTGAVLLIRRKGPDAWFRSPAGTALLIFSAVLTVIVLQHWITGALYPIHRVGLFLFVLFMFAIIATLHELLNEKALFIAGAILVLPVAFHMLYCANTGYILEWQASAGTQRAVNDIAGQLSALTEKRERTTVYTMGVNGSAMQFIRERDHLGWLDVRIDWKSNQPAAYDFYYVEKWALPSFDVSHWIPVDTLPYSGNVLFMDEAFARYQQRFSNTSSTTEKNPSW